MPFVSSSSVTTQSGNDVINRAIRLFMSGHNEQVNKLDVTITPDTSTLQFRYDLGSIREGSVIECGMEQMHVWSSTGKNAPVERGWNGTDADVHEEGSIVRVNPRVTRFEAFNALNEELISLAANGLFAMAYIEFDYQSNRISYDMTDVDNLTKVYKLRQKEPGGITEWRDLRGWSHDASASLDDFPSGHSLLIPRAEPGQSIQALYKAKFGTLLSPEDDLFETAGLPPEMIDIVTWGVLLRLGPVREIKRSFTESQGDSRRAADVPPNAVQTSFTSVRSMRNDRIREEKRRLARLYPEVRP